MDQAAAGDGQRVRAVYAPDYHLSSVLKRGNHHQDHDWQQKLIRDLERYNIPVLERTRFMVLPKECESENEFITGTNTEVLQLFDAAAIARMEALILKAKGRLNNKNLKPLTDFIKEVLLYAKPKRRSVQQAGGFPVPFPDHFSKRIIED